MNKQIEIIKNTRKSLIGFVEDLTIEELNEIPQGFNNNIIWNLTHLIATQQNICYVRSGLKITVNEKYFTGFKPDTKPEGHIDSSEAELIKKLMLSTIDRFESDYDNNLFVHYTPWSNRYGVTIANIEEVLGFLPYHEGLHRGYITALKRMIRNKKAAG